MKKFRFAHVFITLSLLLTTIAPSLYAQQQSRLEQTITILEDYAAKVPQLISKTIRCARGLDTCTQAEITQARATVSAIGAALAVIGLSIAAGITAQKLEWWPFGRKKVETKEPEIIQPTPPAMPPITQEEVGNAADTLVKIYAMPAFLLPKEQTRIQQAIIAIDTAIDQGVIDQTLLKIPAPGQTYTLENVIKYFVDRGLATSKYVQ